MESDAFIEILFAAFLTPDWNRDLHYRCGWVVVASQGLAFRPIPHEHNDFEFFNSYAVFADYCRQDILLSDPFCFSAIASGVYGADFPVL